MLIRNKDKLVLYFNLYNNNKAFNPKIRTKWYYILTYTTIKTV
jgi:hypothetical protein